METLLIRLEGPLSSWGAGSRFSYRQTATFPTKSAVVGMICGCMGLTREAASSRLPEINSLSFGVRADRPGTLLKDYQTVAGSLRANREGVSKDNTGESVREYLEDASFLVAMGGDQKVVEEVAEAIQMPKFTPYLGRKCCVPTRPLFESAGQYENLKDALGSHPWRPRSSDPNPGPLSCVIEADRPGPGRRVVQDVLVNINPLTHSFRVVEDTAVTPPVGERVTPVVPTLVRGEYGDDWLKVRAQRLAMDHYTCVVCQLPARQVHHLTYERIGQEDVENDLRSVCIICHEVITALEYSQDLRSNERIDPFIPEWRKRIIQNRETFLKERR